MSGVSPRKTLPRAPTRCPGAGSGPRGMVGAAPAFPGLAEAARPPQPPQPKGDPVPIPPTSEGTRGRGRPTCAGPSGCPGLGWGVLQSPGGGVSGSPRPPLHRHRATVPRQSRCAGFACRLPHVARLSRRTKPLRLAAPAGSRWTPRLGGDAGVPAAPGTAASPSGRGVPQNLASTFGEPRPRGVGRWSPPLWQCHRSHCGPQPRARVPGGSPRSLGRSRGGGGGALCCAPTASTAAPRHAGHSLARRGHEHRVVPEPAGSPGRRPPDFAPANTAHGPGAASGLSSPRPRCLPGCAAPGMAGSRCHSRIDRGCSWRGGPLWFWWVLSWVQGRAGSPSQSHVPPGLCQQPDPDAGEPRGPLAPRPTWPRSPSQPRGSRPCSHTVPEDRVPPPSPDSGSWGLPRAADPPQAGRPRHPRRPRRPHSPAPGHGWGKPSLGSPPLPPRRPLTCHGPVLRGAPGGAGAPGGRRGHGPGRGGRSRWRFSARWSSGGDGGRARARVGAAARGGPGASPPHAPASPPAPPWRAVTLRPRRWWRTGEADIFSRAESLPSRPHCHRRGLPPAPRCPNPAPPPPRRAGGCGVHGGWELEQPNRHRTPRASGCPRVRLPPLHGVPFPKSRVPPQQPPAAPLHPWRTGGSPRAGGGRGAGGSPGVRGVPRSQGVPQHQQVPRSRGGGPQPTPPHPPHRTHLQADPGLRSPRALPPVTMAWRRHVPARR